jgi:catechol 2,3-dioxygenase-like lactoylglutathione lyase family enzyme
LLEIGPHHRCPWWAPIRSYRRRPLESRVERAEREEESAMPPRVFRIVLPVDDLAVAGAFWSALLELPLDDAIPSRHYLATDGAVVVLVDEHEHDTFHGLAPRAFRPNPDVVYFAVADLDAAYARAVKLGMRPIGDDHLGEGIAQRPWGERSFYGRDPAGNPFCVADESNLYLGSE